MKKSDNKLRVIVLSAQRAGVRNELAARFNVSHKCLIPLMDQPLIQHVLETLGAHEDVDEIAISIEPEAFSAVQAIVDRLGINAKVSFVSAADNLADSVFAATDGLEGPAVITTADNALLKPSSINAMHDALKTHDVAIGLSTKGAVRAVHKDAQRNFYELRDDGYSNCNLYGMASKDALKAAEIFRSGGQFAANRNRMIEAFGLFNLLLMRFKLVTMESAMKRISRRIGLSIAPVVFTDGTQAVDVDNDRTYGIVELVLKGEAG